jgi:plasmid maintenance system antidote protein VapI
MNKRERIFSEAFFDSPADYKYQPRHFLLNGKRYTPDFFDKRTATYLEVVGSRQAYHFNKGKYEMMAVLYPHINFEVRSYTGELYSERPRYKREHPVGVFKLAKATGYSASMASNILSGKRRPGLQGALRLERVTGIPVKTWARGTPKQIRKEYDKWASAN